MEATKLRKRYACLQPLAAPKQQIKRAAYSRSSSTDTMLILLTQQRLPLPQISRLHPRIIKHLSGIAGHGDQAGLHHVAAVRRLQG